ncbi:MAG: VCBS repeat-containing protein [Planctomycetes bacterium]|nr:VCBS repeat-containing protein [Planctomycetota bacterium]
MQPCPWLLVIVAAITAGTNATAQQFAPQPTLRLAFGEVLAAAADLDGDGDDDLVAVNEATGIVTPLLSNGVGGFERGVEVAAPAALVTLGMAAVGDVDRDGDLDVVVARRPTGALVLRNDRGRLSAAGTIALPGTPRLLELLDLDRDDAPDLVLVTDDAWSALRNDGVGNFAPGPWTFPTGSFAVFDAVFADFDRDGSTDVAIAGHQRLRLWLRRGNAFVDESSSRVPSRQLEAITTLDLDRDGDPDLAGMSNAGSGSLWLYRNHGTGQFGDASSLLPGSLHLTRSGARALDANGDGLTDLWFGSTVVALATGPATFVAGPLTPILGRAVCDLHGDGLDDLFGLHDIAFNVQGQRFQTPVRFTAALAADLDRDGDPDLIGGTLLMSLTEASESPGLRTMAIPSTGPGERTSADINGDGHLDVLGNTGQGPATILNDGFGNLRAVALLPPSSSTLINVPFDRDHDGDVDILVLGTMTTQLFDNQGSGVFAEVTAAALPPLVPGIDHAEAGDVDADGDLDLLLGRPLPVPGSRPALLRNRGNGTFVDAGSTFHCPPGFQRANLAQIDDDPELEIVLSDPSIRVLERILGVWQDVSAARLPGTVPATRVVVVDLDGDGRRDLVADGGVMLRNTGSGRFADVTRERGLGPGRVVAAVDYDGDGDQDLLDGDLVWLNRQRQLQFASHARIGGALRLEFVGEHGYGQGLAFALTAFGLQRAPRGTPTLGGTLFVDPGSAVTGPILVSVAGSPAGSSSPIPLQATLLGLRVQIQGLVIGGDGSLTPANHLATTID